ncbi:hypothetical protein CDAR_221921 [Caerostris darwini]|uniref:Uncharacterized protein n=1 Tax=Caerostris darwini TaxID=1538125 RepID=A0AAV4WXM1_9ARAC|nr:hypothetical protein CDAR_221921 [Caerostris darwini]
MTIKHWEYLGHNSDTEIDKTTERKINELANQKNGLEEQVRAYGPCPISLCIYHHNNKKVKHNDDNNFKLPAKRHTSSKHYVAHEERNVTSDVPFNTNRFAPLNQEENLNNPDIAPVAPRIPPIMITPNYPQVTPNAVTSNITNPPTITPNLLQQAPFFNPDELHKTLYILKEIVNLFTSTSSVDSVFKQLSQAKATEDNFLVLLNGLAKSTSSQNKP